MTATATETYPGTVHADRWARLKTELSAAGTRDDAASLTEALADWADETAKALRDSGQEPTGEHFDPDAWTDIATWLRLISGSLVGEVEPLLVPDDAEYWKDVTEADQEAWLDLADADDRREWAAAWSTLQSALKASPAHPFTKEQITTLAGVVMDAPW